MVKIGIVCLICIILVNTNKFQCLNGASHTVILLFFSQLNMNFSIMVLFFVFLSFEISVVSSTYIDVRIGSYNDKYSVVNSHNSMGLNVCQVDHHCNVTVTWHSIIKIYILFRSLKLFDIILL